VVGVFAGDPHLRYLLSARVRPEKRAELLRALEEGRFGEGFPYGDLGETLCTGRVDGNGTIRWVEVCYCREYYGVAMAEELPYFEAVLTDMTVTDARSPDHCEGYPACGDCDCTRKVRPKGEPLLDHLARPLEAAEPGPDTAPVVERPTRWLGWRGRVTPEVDWRIREATLGIGERPAPPGGSHEVAGSARPCARPSNGGEGS
jgi:hypothetical protein